MTTAGGVSMAQYLIVYRGAGISMFVGAALFLLVKVTLHVWMWFPTEVLSVFTNLRYACMGSPHHRPIPP